MQEIPRHAGFTVVEVVIAVLVLFVAASAIGLAAVSGTSARGAAKLQAALTATGESIQDDIATNRDWMSRPDCKVVDQECSVATGGVIEDDSLKLEDVDGKVTLQSATATALDSEADKKGAQDRDGVIPDFWRVGTCSGSSSRGGLPGAAFGGRAKRGDHGVIVLSGGVDVAA